MTRKILAAWRSRAGIELCHNGNTITRCAAQPIVCLACRSERIMAQAMAERGYVRISWLPCYAAPVQYLRRTTKVM
jgi:hypothetical protein